MRSNKFDFSPLLSTALKACSNAGLFFSTFPKLRRRQRFRHQNQNVYQVQQV
jgi:hypothetical protein